MKKQKSPTKLGIISVRELDPATWKDFEKLFERHGGVWGGCWCMYYHVANGWSKRTPKRNKTDKKALVRDGKAHGLLLYSNEDPVGWCQYGPPDELPRMDKKRRSYRRPKDFWRLTCFFVDKRYRKKGVARLLLDAALMFMKARGVKMLEAYPIDTGKGKYSSSFLWPGTVQLFEAAGFRIVGRLGKSSRVARKRLTH
ncbi:MAG: GNAT family N-acetyltransferase [Nitrososphaerales archaeon]